MYGQKYAEVLQASLIIGFTYIAGLMRPAVAHKRRALAASLALSSFLHAFKACMDIFTTSTSSCIDTFFPTPFTSRVLVTHKHNFSIRSTFASSNGGSIFGATRHQNLRSL
mmetsp:Transcript_23555/g.38386  ORF Transcript_23555/g.38386 Transcript_23555/m.38386 type:complete len:111 (+) Transcript_23555:1898-2230(+)